MTVLLKNFPKKIQWGKIFVKKKNSTIRIKQSKLKKKNIIQYYITKA